MRTSLAVALLALLSGCAFPSTVQRMGVDYNGAVAGMANELTLLNIVRAKEQLPLHYTSVSRLTGSLTLKGSASIGDEIRGTETTTTTSASPSTVTKTGVDTLKPTISGEVNTGSNFDIAILDTQKFYQGITAAIPFTTVENYIAQGFPNQLLTRLVVERIDFKDGEDGPNKGKLLFSWVNAPSGSEAAEFAKNMACYQLLGRGEKKPVDLAPVSRLSPGEGGMGSLLTIEQLALLDGKSLELSKPLTTNPADDSTIFIRRVGGERRKADLQFAGGTCPDRATSEAPPADAPAIKMIDPTKPPAGPPPYPVYLGNGKAIVLGADRASDRDGKVEAEIIFRSPESIIRYVGRYLSAEPTDRYLVDGKPLFALTEGHDDRDLVSVKLLGAWHGISRHEQPRNSMIVLGLIEQLINLHKESGDRPVTVPVQVINGP